MKLHEKIGLKESELNEIVKTISSIEHIQRAVIYGSRAKGNYKTYSDIDLTLSGTNLCTTDIFRLADCFEESNLPYLFDISNFDNLKNLALIDHIKRCGITIFERI